MRALLFYDLPTDYDESAKVYRKFHSNIIKLGYVMIQNSVYVKVLNSPSISKQHRIKVKKMTPECGNVRLMIVTEKQYDEIEILSGEKTENEVINGIETFTVI